ncbi:sigma-70 region 4 domain-containing protein [Marinimicrobium sp. C2-29]|uniref:sigma-70 region 4 domain-containing protein n=1 Tax=Marinimicrobium sp. C2-29 TaxID=3139825 RepID=UPI0031395C90
MPLAQDQFISTTKYHLTSLITDADFFDSLVGMVRNILRPYINESTECRCIAEDAQSEIVMKMLEELQNGQFGSLEKFSGESRVPELLDIKKIVMWRAKRYCLTRAIRWRDSRISEDSKADTSKPSSEQGSSDRKGKEKKGIGSRARVYPRAGQQFGSSVDMDSDEATFWEEVIRNSSSHQIYGQSRQEADLPTIEEALRYLSKRGLAPSKIELVKFRYEGKSYDDIAEIVGKSPAAVEKAYKRVFDELGIQPIDERGQSK